MPKKGDVVVVRSIEGQAGDAWDVDFPFFGTIIEELKDEYAYLVEARDGDQWCLYEEDIAPGHAQDANPKDLIGATKPPISLVPPAAIIHMAKAMENGAGKYGAYNWREKKIQALTYIDAADRHILHYLDGEDFASDSGVHHLAHAAACLGMILDALETGNLIDNRPTKGAAPELIKRFTRSEGA